MMDTETQNSTSREFGPPTLYDVLIPPAVGLLFMIIGRNHCRSVFWAMNEQFVIW